MRKLINLVENNVLMESGRLRSDWIPQGAVKAETPSDLPVEIWIFEEDGLPRAIMFSGRRNIPDKNPNPSPYGHPAYEEYIRRYRNEEHRNYAIQEYLDSIRNALIQKELKRTEKKTFTTSLQKGDILFVERETFHTKKIHFYQVVNVLSSGKSVKIREIAKIYDEVKEFGAILSSLVSPIPYKFIGPSITKRASSEYEQDYIKFSHKEIVRKWDGEAKKEINYK